ncbi:hypothetical protein ACVW2L_001732 [Mucilaginibacter sp. HD30]
MQCQILPSNSLCLRNTMNQETFRHINQILARDNKSSTYKFALLRGTIELIEDNSPFIVIKNNGRIFRWS